MLEMGVPEEATTCHVARVDGYVVAGHVPVEAITRLLVDRPDGVGVVGNPTCGDLMEIQILVKEERIEDIRFKTFGCGSAIASSSLATEWVKGLTVDQALDIKNTQIVEELNLPPVKIHCSVLAEDAIKAAIADYKKKNGNADEPIAQEKAQ